MRDSVENLNKPHPLFSCSLSLSSLCKRMLGWSGMNCTLQIHTDYFWSPSYLLDSENAFQERLLQHLSRRWCTADQTVAPWILLPTLLEDWSDIHTHHYCEFLPKQSTGEVEEELFPWGLGEDPGDLYTNLFCYAICGASPVASLHCDWPSLVHKPVHLPGPAYLKAHVFPQPILDSHSLRWELEMRPLRCQLLVVLGTLPCCGSPVLQSPHTVLSMAPGPCCAASAAPPVHSRASLHLVLSLVGAREEHATNPGAGSSGHRDPSTLCLGIAGWAH